MKISVISALLCIIITLVSCDNEKEGKHLFILSGQSNMAALDPVESFIPVVEAGFGAENIIVINDAKGGQPIRRWFKHYDPATEMEGINHPMMYDSLMNKLNPAVENKKFDWVNTDDLNDGFNRRGNPIENDLYMSAEGYKVLGERFADKAIQIIDN